MTTTANPPNDTTKRNRQGEALLNAKPPRSSTQTLALIGAIVLVLLLAAGAAFLSGYTS